MKDIEIIYYPDNGWGYEYKIGDRYYGGDEFFPTEYEAEVSLRKTLIKFTDNFLVEVMEVLNTQQSLEYLHQLKKMIEYHQDDIFRKPKGEIK